MVDRSNEMAREPTTYFAATHDGWRLALHRYPVPGAPTVLVCPGYGCNRFFVDFDARYSLARFFASFGLDSWVVELRGRGASYPSGQCRSPDWWTFDDLALVDVPAVLSFVRGEVGHERMVWVGHSMGGMLLYAYLSAAGEEGPKPLGGVTLASPVVFPPVASEAARYLGQFFLSLPIGSRVPQRQVLGALWRLVGWTRAVEIGMNPANTDLDAAGEALRKALTNVSRGKLRQLAHWSMTGRFASADGTLDYRAGLRRVALPFLVCAGAADRLATVEAVGRGFELLGSPEKEFVVFSKDAGFSADYGHVDLVFGHRVREEVFPLLVDWITQAVGRC
ncbi:MAG: hydrolase [Candidatus Binatia bacterium]|nr:MAG: hydrolase [Candidatus Binatia bacterium]